MKQHPLPDPSWAFFEKLSPAKNYQEDQMIYWQGEQAPCFYYLKEGRVKIFLSSENGTEKTLLILKAGTLFGEAAFFDGLPRVSSAKTRSQAKIVSVDRQTLLTVFRQKPEFAMNMLSYLSGTVRMLSAQVDNMTFLQADRRIARQLLHLSDDNHLVSATHEELGNLAGTSRVTVSKILNQFVKNHWIQTDYKSILILDEKELHFFANS